MVRSGLIPARDLSTQATSSSVSDPNPNWSNRPAKETILLDGCDFEHWLIVMEQPEGDLTRDEIIDYYIKTLAQVVGRYIQKTLFLFPFAHFLGFTVSNQCVSHFSEEEARMKIYSVSHRCYFAFGALVSEDLSHKIKGKKLVFVFSFAYVYVLELLALELLKFYSLKSRIAQG